MNKQLRKLGIILLLCSPLITLQAQEKKWIGHETPAEKRKNACIAVDTLPLRYVHPLGPVCNTRPARMGET